LEICNLKENLPKIQQIHHELCELSNGLCCYFSQPVAAIILNCSMAVMTTLHRIFSLNVVSFMETVVSIKYNLHDIVIVGTLVYTFVFLENEVSKLRYI